MEYRQRMSKEHPNGITREEAEKFLNSILEIWVRFPHLRFGQLIEASRMYGCRTHSQPVLFYTEDSELLETLRMMYDKSA